MSIGPLRLPVAALAGGTRLVCRATLPACLGCTATNATAIVRTATARTTGFAALLFRMAVGQTTTHQQPSTSGITYQHWSTGLGPAHATTLPAQRWIN